MDKVRTRFAPSPTGFMHIGNLRTGLYAYLFAKKNGGDFVLRIEDTDQARYVDGAVQVIYNTLKTAGIDYDEGPDKDKGFGPYIQSERKSLYLKYALELIERGGAYYCFCDKEKLDSLADSNGVRKYDKHCLHLSKAEIEDRLKSGQSYVIRQNIPAEGEGSYVDMVYGKVTVPYHDMEDCILIKSDGMPTYNFANVVDDHLMQISHVIRGNEYLSSTPQYNLLYDSFGWERPTYMHLAPIMKDETRKLSKRYGDANFEDFIQKGYLPEAIVNYIALLGWCPKDNREKMTMSEMIEAFDVDGISISSSIFDEVKMKWLNGEYIKELSDEKFYKLSLPYFKKGIASKYDYRKIAPLLKTRVDILSDVEHKTDFLAQFGEYDKNIFITKRMPDLAIAKASVDVALEALKNLDNWSVDSIRDCLSACAEANSIKNGHMVSNVRVAITGTQVTPGGAFEMADILGKEFTGLERYGHKVYGPFTMKTRHEMLERLLKLPQQYPDLKRELDAMEYVLITPEEIQAIVQIWIYEGDSIREIRELFTRCGMDAPYITSLFMNDDSMNILEDICALHEVPVDLIQKLLMVENDRSGLSRRNGVYNKLDGILETYVLEDMLKNAKEKQS